MAKNRMFAVLLTLGTIACLPLCAPFAKASQFSADIVSTNADGQPVGPPGKVFVSNDKARIETSDLADGFFVVDGAVNAAFFVRPVQQVFMDAKQSSHLTQILVPIDAEDPCKKWQAMAKNAGVAETGSQWRCGQIGEAVIEGRKTIAYFILSPPHKPNTEWIDSDLKFVVRSQTEDGIVIDLKNIHEGLQPRNLFEIPASYHKFDPQHLIEIIKRSDVWVEPNK